MSSLVSNRCAQTVEYNYYLQSLGGDNFNVRMYCNSVCTSCNINFDVTLNVCTGPPNFYGDSFELTSAQCLGGYPQTAPQINNSLSIEVYDTDVCGNTSTIAVYNMGNVSACQLYVCTYACLPLINRITG